MTTEINMKDQLNDLRKEVTSLKKTISGLKELIDKNKDGKITGDEIKAFAVHVAHEYIWIYLGIVMSLFGLFKPWEDWSRLWDILSISLSISIVIFGGYMKNEITKVLIKRDIIERDKDAIIDANKEALNKSVIVVGILKNEIVMLKNDK